MKKYKPYVFVIFAYICVRSPTVAYLAYVMVTIRTVCTEACVNVRDIFFKIFEDASCTVLPYREQRELYLHLINFFCNVVSTETSNGA